MRHRGSCMVPNGRSIFPASKPSGYKVNSCSSHCASSRAGSVTSFCPATRDRASGTETVLPDADFFVPAGSLCAGNSSTPTLSHWPKASTTVAPWLRWSRRRGLRNSIFLQSKVRLLGSGTEKVLFKEPSVTPSSSSMEIRITMRCLIKASLTTVRFAWINPTA